MNDPINEPLPAPFAEPEKSSQPSRDMSLPSRIDRGRIGLNVSIQVLLGVILFIIVNYLGSRYFRQWDHTYDRSFTLAPATSSYLESCTMPVRIYVLAERGGSVEKDITPMVDQYKKALGSKLDVQFIDTKRDVSAWENFKLAHEKSNVDIRSNGILVEAQAPMKSADGKETSSLKWIPEETLYVLDADKKSRIGFRGESLINTALRAVTNPDRPLVGIVSGIGKLLFTPNGTSIIDVLTEVAARQNFDFQPWHVTSDPDGGKRFKAVIMVSPDAFGTTHDEILTKFLETGGNGVMVMLNPQAGSNVLDSWLGKYGLAPQNDRVLTARSTATGPIKRLDIDVRFVEGSSINAGIVNDTSLLLGQTRSIKLLSGLPKQRDENIVLTPLLETDSNFWGEIDFKESLPKMDPGVDNGSPLYVAATMERGGAKDPRVQLQSSRLVVTGNSRFADPDTVVLNERSYDFLTRSLNWLLHRDVTASHDNTMDKEKHKFSIRITPPQWQRLFIISTIVLPLAALMTGLVIWSSRRS